MLNYLIFIFIDSPWDKVMNKSLENKGTTWMKEAKTLMRGTKESENMLN